MESRKNFILEGINKTINESFKNVLMFGPQSLIISAKYIILHGDKELHTICSLNHFFWNIYF